MDRHVAAAVEHDLEMVAAAPGVLDHVAAEVTAVGANGRRSGAAGRNADRHFHEAAAAIVRNLQDDLLRVARVPLAPQKAMALVVDAAGLFTEHRRLAAGAAG